MAIKCHAGVLFLRQHGSVCGLEGAWRDYVLSRRPRPRQRFLVTPEAPPAHREDRILIQNIGGGGCARGVYEGVRLMYGRKSGYGGYGPPPGWLRGARVIELHENPFRVGFFCLPSHSS
jgi:hypothetical protein